MSKKANALAVAIIAIAIIVAAIALSGHVIRRPRPESAISISVNELEILIQRALEQSIENFANHGYGYETDVWYCNKPMPPDFEESKDALYEWLEQTLAGYIDELNEQRAEQGYQLSGPSNIKIHSLRNVSSINDFPDNNITVEVEGLVASITEKNKIVEQELSKTYEFDIRTWFIYKRLHQWIESNADEFAQDLQEKLEEKPCKARTCSCLPKTPTLNEGAIENMSLTQTDIEDFLGEKLQELNSIFSGTEIRCSYEITKQHIENFKHYNYIELEDEGDNNYTGRCERIYTKTGLSDRYIDQEEGTLVLELVDPLTEPGCPTSREVLYNTSYSFSGTINQTGNRVEGSHHDAPEMELLAISKAAAALVRFKCQDNNPLYRKGSAAITIRFNVYYQCPLPEESFGETSRVCPEPEDSEIIDIIGVDCNELCKQGRLEPDCWYCSSEQCFTYNRTLMNDCTFCHDGQKYTADEMEGLGITIDDEELEGVACMSANGLTHSNCGTCSRDGFCNVVGDDWSCEHIGEACEMYCTSSGKCEDVRNEGNTCPQGVKCNQRYQRTCILSANGKRIDCLGIEPEGYCCAGRLCDVPDCCDGECGRVCDTETG